MPRPPAFSDDPTPTPTSTTTTGAATVVVSAPLPRFLDRRPQLEPLPEGATVEPGEASPTPDDVAGGPRGDESTASPGRRTNSSAGSAKADPTVVAGMLAAVIGIAATLAAGLLLRSPRPRELRKPTNEQRDDIAAPLGRIASRHVPAALLVPDLMDGIAAAAAVSAYVAEAPLTYPAHYAGDIPAGDDTTPEE